MEISKRHFLDAAARGDLCAVKAYLAQPQIARLVEMLERMLDGNANSSTCDRVRAATRTMVAMNRDLWFCGDGQWATVFMVALRHRHLHVLEWFFSSKFAMTVPTTLQVVFPHVARRAVARNDWESVEMLLTSILYGEIMEENTKQSVLGELLLEAKAHKSGDVMTAILTAHGAQEALSPVC